MCITKLYSMTYTFSVAVKLSGYQLLSQQLNKGAFHHELDSIFFQFGCHIELSSKRQQPNQNEL